MLHFLLFVLLGIDAIGLGGLPLAHHLLSRRSSSEALLDLDGCLLHLGNKILRGRLDDKSADRAERLRNPRLDLRLSCGLGGVIDNGETAQEVLDVHLHRALASLVGGALGDLREELAGESIQLGAREAKVEHAQYLADLLDVHGTIAVLIEHFQGLVEVHVQAHDRLINGFDRAGQEVGVLLGVHVHYPTAEHLVQVDLARTVEDAPLLDAFVPRDRAVHEVAH
mmetsp:Transcript_30326/g.87469  ORF Transcript_30326/g.87469 Transcript_30326/m.87469 type:complete len:225 (-) Transcript_30326:1737-2411(-)